MIKHRLKGLTTSFGTQVIDPEKAEELKRTKSDIESNLTRILKLIQNEDQTKKDGNPKDSRKETELVGLIEDFYTQYQSLYALYDRLTAENGILVPRRIERKVSSLSSSSSESEYFSSDEVDGIIRRHLPGIEHQNLLDFTKNELEITNTEVYSPREKEPSNMNPLTPLTRAEVINKSMKINADNHNIERDRSLLANDHEVLETKASARAKELEEQLTWQKKELESLSQHQRDLELQLESNATEAKQLSAKNTFQILELEELVKTKEREITGLQAKLKHNENQATSNVAELMAQINNLQMDKKITRNRDEAQSQMEGLRDQIHVMQQNLDSLCNQNKELEAQMEKKTKEISQYLIQIENLNEQLAEKSSVEQRMLEEKEGFLVRVKDLELEVEPRSRHQNELEERLGGKSYEIKQLGDENKALQDRNLELKKSMTQRGEQLSALVREHESGKIGASLQAMALTAEVNDLRLELDSLKEQKSKLELQKEQNQKEYSESLAKMENSNVNLGSKIADQEKIIKEQAETIERISREYEEAKIWMKKLKLNRQLTERRTEELAEEVRKKLEDNIRLLYQRIYVAEQLHTENKDSYKLAKERYEQENRMLEEKIAGYENEVKGLRVTRVTEIDVLNGLDLAAGKLEEHKNYILSRVSKMLDEVQFAKDWIKKKNGEMRVLKDNVGCLTALLDDKEEQEFLLREKAWKLEAKVSKEGGEKLNLMKSVSQLEKKVGRLEKKLKEKDEELVSVGEMKREAIRQLCFVNDYHRNRCDYLKDLISKIIVSNRKRA